jgi:urease accessory protein
VNPNEHFLVGLQLGDSFFPSGASAHSHGLEGLHQSGELEGLIDLESFLGGQLEQRWASSDRVALLHAHAAGSDLVEVAAIDDWVDRSTCVQSWRLGGRRLGRALLDTHARLGTSLSVEYRQRVAEQRAPGQGSVVQGLLGFALGLSPGATAALSAYGLSVSVVGAALRLGIIGHVDAQRLLTRQRSRSVRLIELPLPPLDELGAWVPAAEIASMQQEARRGRLFAT